LGEIDEEGRLLIKQRGASILTVEDYYEELNFHKAMMEIMRLADMANKYIDEQAPWSVVKTDPEKARQICTTGLNALKILSGLLQPVLPVLAGKVAKYLGFEPLTWSTIRETLENVSILPYEHMAERIDLNVVKELLSD